MRPRVWGVAQRGEHRRVSCCVRRGVCRARSLLTRDAGRSPSWVGGSKRKWERRWRRPLRNSLRRSIFAHLPLRVVDGGCSLPKRLVRTFLDLPPAAHPLARRRVVELGLGAMVVAVAHTGGIPEGGGCLHRGPRFCHVIEEQETAPPSWVGGEAVDWCEGADGARQAHELRRRSTCRLTNVRYLVSYLSSRSA